MLKYVDAKVTFSEIVDQVTLCINFSGCKIKCPDCHSKYLWEDVGEYLTFDKLNELILKNDGITCVCFMGGAATEIQGYVEFIKENFPYKTAWYTGEQMIVFSRYLLDNLDYLKIGPYIKEYGGLNKSTTNQRMYKIENITHEFQRSKP